MIESKYNELRTASNVTGRTSNSLEPKFIHQNQNRTPPKSPNFEPIHPEIGRTQAQICKNRTSNLSKLRFVYQNQAMNPPEPFKNPELRTHEVGLTQHQGFSSFSPLIFCWFLMGFFLNWSKLFNEKSLKIGKKLITLFDWCSTNTFLGLGFG